MASFWYHATVTKMIKNDLDIESVAGVKIGLWSESEPGTKDDDFADDLQDELAASGYTSGFGGAGRKSLANRVINDDATLNRSVFDNTADITWTTLGATTPDTIDWAIVIRENTADSDSEVIIALDVADYLTSGGDYTIQFADGATQGVGYIDCGTG